MKCSPRFTILNIVTTIILASAASAEPSRVALWPGKAPVAEGETENANAYITVYHPEKANGTAIIICPGGGYGTLVKGAEGHGIARWLLQQGVTAVVLEYRLPRGRSLRPLYDAQRAIRMVRTSARKWKCDPKRIGIMGFSAGGHLASAAATHFDSGDATGTDPIARTSCRPDFSILIYPVITMGPKTHRGSRNNLLGRAPTAKQVELFSSEKQVTRETPPSFLAHAKDDRLVPAENSQMFYDALRRHKVPAKYLKLSKGGHGLNGYKGPEWEAWKKQSLEWLKEQRLIR